MKQLAIALFIVIFLLTLPACTSSDVRVEIPDALNTLGNDMFLSQEEKDSWYPYLVSILSKAEIHDSDLGILGSFAAGLMDLDLDNTPEVILAYAGGSMGNVYLEIYDLRSEEKIDYYNASHWNGSDNIYLCVAQKDNAYIILTQGSIRIIGADFDYSIGTLETNRSPNEDYIKVTSLFSCSTESGETTYRHHGKAVEKTEYDTLYEQFLTEYIIMEETQIELIKWTSLGKLERKNFGYKEGIDPESKQRLAEKMTDALLNSEQKFVRFQPPSDFSSEEESLSSIRESSSIEENRYTNVPFVYRPLLAAYEKMALYKKDTNSTEGIVFSDYPHLAKEHFDALLAHTEKYNSYGMGYFLTDVNLDGTNELVYSFWGGGTLCPYNIYMIYTTDGNEAKLVGVFEDTENWKYDTQIGDDGKLHFRVMGKGEGFTHTIMTFDKNGTTESFSYCLSDYTGFYDCEVEWLKLENGEWINITEQEFIYFEELYDYNEVKGNYDFHYFFEFAPK